MRFFFFLIISMSSFYLVGCNQFKKIDDATDDVGQMKDRTTEMNEQMKSTNDSIRQQRLLLALENAVAESSLERLYPVPTGVMPGAKKFAEAVHADEVLDLTYLWLKEIDEVTPFAHLNLDGTERGFDANEFNEILIKKYGRLQALFAIAGFLPETIVDEIIQNVVQGSGRYQTTALNLLMMRTLFCKQILLDENLLQDGAFKSVGEAEQALEYMDSVNKILRLPFASSLFLKTRGLNGPAGYNGPIANVDLTMDSDLTKSLADGWNQIVNASEALQIRDLKLGGNPTLDQKIVTRDRNRKNQVINKAQAEARTWVP